ncbi:MAG TPA: hypothetical protein VJB11_01265 [archaeon]|nr:hypothetical protein [archaeon]
MSKPRIKKGMDSLRKQIDIHKEKLRIAQEMGNIGLSNYYEKEIEHFERAREKLARHILPKKRKK